MTLFVTTLAAASLTSLLLLRERAKTAVRMRPMPIRYRPTSRREMIP